MNTTKLVAWLALPILLAGCVAVDPADREMARAEKRQEFDRAAGRKPTMRTLHSMATLLAAKGDDEQARIVLMALISEHPGFTPAYNDLAALHQREGHDAEARAVLTAGIEVDPTDPVLHNNMGVCHLHAGEYEQALERFNHAAELDPLNERYQGNRALATGLLGDDEGAMKVYRTFLSEIEARENVRAIAKIRGTPADSTEAPQAPEGNVEAVAE